MATNISEQRFLGKFSGLLFSNRTASVEAKRHAGWLDQIKIWRMRRAAQIELSGLSDRELADIGLTRQEIPAVVRNGR